MSLAYATETTSPFGRIAPHYTVRKSGTTYLAESRFDLHPLADTSLNQLWLDINAEVTGPTVEWSKDTFTVDAPLEILASNTANTGQGSHHTVFKPADNMDDDVWRLDPGNYYYNVLFEKLMIDGNRANEAAGRGLEWDVTVAATVGASKDFHYMLRLDGVFIADCDDEGLYFRTTTGNNIPSQILNSEISFNGPGASGYQIYLQRFFDSRIADSSMNSIRLVDGASNEIHGIYLGGGVADVFQLDGGTADYPNAGNIFTNCRFDHPTSSALLLDDYALNNIFSGCMFTNFLQGSTTDTYPAVDIQGYSAYNLFDGCFFGHFGNIPATDRWTYAVEETGNAHDNAFYGCRSGYGVIGGGNAEHFTQGEAKLLAGNGTTIGATCTRGDGTYWRIYNT